MGEEKAAYRLKTEGGRLVFQTGSFRAEGESVLHSGIFNREMLSSLAAGALTISVVAGLALSGLGNGVFYLALAVLIFSFSFIFSWMFVFREAELRVTMDKETDKVTIFSRRFLKTEGTYPLSSLSGVKRAKVVFSHENPDGVRFVEKIALQHGTVIPGFGETKTYHTVTLNFGEKGEALIFSSRDGRDAEDVAAGIEGFMAGGNA